MKERTIIMIVVVKPVPLKAPREWLFKIGRLVVIGKFLKWAWDCFFDPET